jgi:hypothetical protein
MPRVAAADFPPIGEIDRPGPPPDLSEAAAVVWRAAVNSMRPTWFSAENFALLETYCVLTVEKRRLEVAFGRLDVGDARYAELVRRHDRMATQTLAHARALRLTPRANATNRDARDAGRAIVHKPWEG